MWIIFSFSAAIFFALRIIVLKKYLNNIDILLLAFISRVFGFIALLPLLFFFDLQSYNCILFWKIIIITSFLTGVASIGQLFAIKKYNISSSVPFLSFIPLFMILAVFIFFKEIPGPYSFTGLIFLSFGVFIINFKKKTLFKQNIKNIFKNKGAVIFLIIAFIYGFTTTLDRFAIDNAHAGGFTYSFYWNLFSALLFSLIFLNFKKVKLYIFQIKTNILPLFIQSIFGVSAFLSQMVAVEFAKNINANIIYVKAITMFQILFVVLAGIIVFKEKNAFYKITGSVSMISGAIIILYFF